MLRMRLCRSNRQRPDMRDLDIDRCPCKQMLTRLIRQRQKPAYCIDPIGIRFNPKPDCLKLFIDDVGFLPFCRVHMERIPPFCCIGNQAKPIALPDHTPDAKTIKALRFAERAFFAVKHAKLQGCDPLFF